MTVLVSSGRDEMVDSQSGGYGSLVELGFVLSLAISDFKGEFFYWIFYIIEKIANIVGCIQCIVWIIWGLEQEISYRKKYWNRILKDYYYNNKTNNFMVFDARTKVNWIVIESNFLNDVLYWVML